MLSVAANPACPDTETAERAVNEVWDSCFPDTRPFDEVSWPRRSGVYESTLTRLPPLDLLELDNSIPIYMSSLSLRSSDRFGPGPEMPRWFLYYRPKVPKPPLQR